MKIASAYFHIGLLRVAIMFDHFYISEVRFTQNIDYDFKAVEVEMRNFR